MRVQTSRGTFSCISFRLFDNLVGDRFKFGQWNAILLNVTAGPTVPYADHTNRPVFCDGDRPCLRITDFRNVSETKRLASRGSNIAPV